ncbi:Diadenosine tetraphosphate (Ap4A) hydrolase [Marinospirillum celere]|uniref:Diadenosine tetraphosphate (Ap4A) hydrolase n=1 Tax=Marinospirillum celere TaxID=1122252 RepID=A0A1I1EBC5_9GAMM|nr:hypothetical protein [Marinospirillum celere]SFB84026.1 Diadenosine tetraphosphate (Ap4A) hydrolase [Marinospirillum celere]
MSILVDFHDKFRVVPLKVLENTNWVLSVRPQQLTLGSMVLSVKQERRGFAELSGLEHQEMGALLGQAERLAMQVFQADRINVLCLMMQDPLLHFHIFPRYSKTQTFAGIQWDDSDWPGPPHIAPVATDECLQIEILNSLTSYDAMYV